MAGIIPLANFIDRLEIGKIFREVLGERPPQAFQWDNLAKAWILTTFTKGFHLINADDIKYDTPVLKDFEMPSHDVLGRVMKGLATLNERVKRPKSRNKRKVRGNPKDYVINNNSRLVDLNLEVLKNLGLLNENSVNTLDVDASHLPSECKESQVSYEDGPGFFPMFGTIGPYALMSSMRQGNVSPHFGIVEFLQQTFTILDRHNISVDRIHLDSVGFKKIVTEYIDRSGRYFLTGIRKSDTTFNILNNSIGQKGVYKKKSKKVRFLKAEYCEAPYCFPHSTTKFRLVAVRVAKIDYHTSQDDTLWEFYNGYFYKTILTNDWASSPKDLVYEYNERGNSEKVFGELKNGVGISSLPFSKLNENHVYVQIQMILHNIFKKFINFISSIEEKIDLTTELETFRKRFAVGIAHLIKGLILFGTNNRIDFEKLI